GQYARRLRLEVEAKVQSALAIFHSAHGLLAGQWTIPFELAKANCRRTGAVSDKDWRVLPGAGPRGLPDKLWVCLVACDEQNRRVWLLRYYYELPVEQIAILENSFPPSVAA